MHFAQLDKSERLQKTLSALSGDRWVSTLEIQQKTGSMCPGTDISELRKNGKYIL